MPASLAVPLSRCRRSGGEKPLLHAMAEVDREHRDTGHAAERALGRAHADVAEAGRQDDGAVSRTVHPGAKDAARAARSSAQPMTSPTHHDVQPERE